MSRDVMLPHEHAELKKLDQALRKRSVTQRPHQGLFAEIQRLGRENELVVQSLQAQSASHTPESEQLSLLPEPEQLSLFADG